MSRAVPFVIVTCKDGCGFSARARILPAGEYMPEELAGDVPAEGDPCPDCGGELDHDTDYYEEEDFR